ncbi:MAG TPA: hypothetical protein VJS14_08160, partial [Enterobacteriaceae bacterium]|nr:hypothetical protein [Enterobacteriaceae bacterium]
YIIYPFLKNEFGVVESAYFLGQGIDQGVEIYSYLVNYKYVIEFDLSTIDNTIIKNEIVTVTEYERTLAGKGRAKKEARDLLRQLMKKKDDFSLR